MSKFNVSNKNDDKIKLQTLSVFDQLLIIIK